MKKIQLLSFLVLSITFLMDNALAGPVFDRVMKERTLRCAYTIYPPFFLKDPNTGEFGGIMYDVMSAMSKELGTKVEWTEEVGSDAIFQGFRTGRYDAVCPGYFTTPSRANGGDFTKPIVFVPTYIYVRAGEDRFTSFADFNSEDVKMGTMDGEFSDIIRGQMFPKTQPVSLMALNTAAERFELVSTGKADFTVSEVSTGIEYQENHPGKLKTFGTPVSMGASTVIVPHDEYPLVAFLNAGIDHLVYSGALHSIMKKYTKAEGDYLIPKMSYEVIK